MFNIIRLFGGLDFFLFGLFSTDMRINILWIAIVYGIFNVVTTLILLLFTKQLEKLANFIIKDKGDDGKKIFLERCC